MKLCLTSLLLTFAISFSAGAKTKVAVSNVENKIQNNRCKPHKGWTHQLGHGLRKDMEAALVKTGQFQVAPEKARAHAQYAIDTSVTSFGICQQKRKSKSTRAEVVLNIKIRNAKTGAVVGAFTSKAQVSKKKAALTEASRQAVTDATRRIKSSLSARKPARIPAKKVGPVKKDMKVTLIPRD